jgi:hypothetical protein
MKKPLNDIKVDLANMDHCGTCDHEKVKKDATTTDNEKPKK